MISFDNYIISPEERPLIFTSLMYNLDRDNECSGNFQNIIVRKNYQLINDAIFGNFSPITKKINKKNHHINYLLNRELNKQDSEKLPKAKKHVKICLDAKEQILTRHPDFIVYLATHISGRHGVSYKKVEEESGEKFWKLPFYSQINRKGKLKEPDIVAVLEDKIKYIMEVKWGSIKGCFKTDALISAKECDKINQAFKLGKYVKISKPKTIVYDRDDKTKFIFLSDFLKMKEEFSKKRYKEIVSRLKDLNKEIFITNISEAVDGIPSISKIIG